MRPTSTLDGLGSLEFHRYDCFLSRVGDVFAERLAPLERRALSRRRSLSCHWAHSLRSPGYR